MPEQRERLIDAKAADHLPLGELVGRVVYNLQSIFRAELRLAGVEV
jgi:hypothetical protein